MAMVLKRIFSIGLICIIGVLIYSNSFQAGWHFDDADFITQNPNIRNIHDISAIWNSLAYPIRFVTFYSFALNYHFSQYDIFSYHVVNLGVHLTTAILVWWFMLLMLSTPRMKSSDFAQHKHLFALSVALIFLAHPIQTQAVTYITQRFASLATMFYLASICFYIKGRETRRLLFQSLFILGSLTAALLGMFTKEIVITLPIAIVLIESLFINQTKISEQLKNKTTWIFLSVVLALLLILPFVYKFSVIGMILGDRGVPSGSHAGDVITASSYFWTQASVILTYIRLMFIPVGQQVLYDFPVSTSFFTWQTSLSMLSLLLVCILALKLYKRHALISFGIFWFFLTLSVESSIIPIRHVIFEHRLYLPSVGFSMMVCAWIFTLMKNPKAFRYVISSFVIFLCILTFARNKVWLNEITLWTDNIKKAPRLDRAYLNLGNGYYAQKDYEKALDAYQRGLDINAGSSMLHNNIGNIHFKSNNLGLALSYFERAIQINPRRAVLYSNRADVYRKTKQYQKAIKDYTTAIEKKLRSEQTLTNRGLVYSAIKAYDLSLADFNAAIQLNPHYAIGYNNRGNLYRALKKEDLALLDYNKAIDLDSEFEEAYNNRGVLVKGRGDLIGALADYNKAISLNPAYSAAYNNRATTYMAMKKFDLAIADFTNAIRLNPNLFEAYYNRASAYARTKRYELAIKDYDQVLKLKPNFTNALKQKTVLMNKNKERLSQVE